MRTKIASDKEREAINRYRRFMALNGNKKAIRLVIERLHLSPGIDWGGYSRGLGMRGPSSNKDMMAFHYAMGLYTLGQGFIPGALKILEKELGTNWSETDESGLW